MLTKSFRRSTISLVMSKPRESGMTARLVQIRLAERLSVLVADLTIREHRFWRLLRDLRVSFPHLLIVESSLYSGLAYLRSLMRPASALYAQHHALRRL